MTSTLDIIDNHLRSFREGDLDRLMQDYGDDTVFFTVDGALQGPAAIRAFMAGLFREFAKPGADFDLRVKRVHGDVAYIVWTAATADNVYEFATDTFVVRGGRIAYQSFAGKVEPRR